VFEKDFEKKKHTRVFFFWRFFEIYFVEYIQEKLNYERFILKLEYVDIS